MINLLPPSQKQEIRAGRMNAILVRYIFITISALVLIIVLTAVAYVVMTMERTAAQSAHNENQSEIAKYSKITKDIEEYRANLAIAKTIIAKEIAYSDMILKIAGSIPSGVVLDKLDLSSETLGKPVTLTFKARSEEAVLNLKSTLQKRTDLYSDVKLENVSRTANVPDSESSSGVSHSRYPVNASVNLTINKIGEKQ